MKEMATLPFCMMLKLTKTDQPTQLWKRCQRCRCVWNWNWQRQTITAALRYSDSNSKHWFTTSFLPWRKVPESDARSESLPLPLGVFHWSVPALSLPLPFGVFHWPERHIVQEWGAKPVPSETSDSQLSRHSLVTILVLQSKNIILIDKIIIYKIIKGTRKVYLFWLIDYRHRPVSVQKCQC